MGWSSGVSIFGDVWDVIEPLLPENKKLKVCKKMVTIFEDADCDNLCELDDKYVLAALKELHPQWYTNEDEDE